MSWAEVKKINSDLSTPLNELMIERPSGIVPNPLYASNSDRPYLQTCKSSEIISSDYVESSTESIQRYNELWCYTSPANILRKFDLITGVGTNVLTTNNNITGLTLVTKTYVYFIEKDTTDSSNIKNYLSRYNKNTGEYKKVLFRGDDKYSSFAFMCYEDNIYGYIPETGSNKGFYRVTDNIDSGNTFTYTRISTRGPVSSENSASDYKGCIKSIIELPNNYILLGWNMYYSNGVYLLLINTTTGESTTIGSASNGSKDTYKYTLCAIRDDDENVVGVIFGLSYRYLSLYKVAGTTKPTLTLLIDKLYTYNSGSTADREFQVGYYDKGIFYTLETLKKEYRVDSSLVTPHKNALVFLPKGTKFYQQESEISIFREKLRDCISIENGELIYAPKVLKPNENGIFITEENEIYDLKKLERSYTTDRFEYIYGTFF